MKQLVYKVVLLVLLYASVGLTGIQSIYAQSSSSLHDSLRRMLSQIKEEIKDSTVQKKVMEVQMLYKTNNLDSALSNKLLITDSILVNSGRVNNPVTLSYATTLVQL